ncbi:hypothetical protein ACPA9J_27045 [Pseudomonas aeruginosa]
MASPYAHVARSRSWRRRPAHATAAAARLAGTRYFRQHRRRRQVARPRPAHKSARFVRPGGSASPALGCFAAGAPPSASVISSAAGQHAIMKLSRWRRR